MNILRDNMYIYIYIYIYIQVHRIWGSRERERGGTYEGTTVTPREAKDLEMDWTVWRM